MTITLRLYQGIIFKYTEDGDNRCDFYRTDVYDTPEQVIDEMIINRDEVIDECERMECRNYVSDDESDSEVDTVEVFNDMIEELKERVQNHYSQDRKWLGQISEDFDDVVVDISVIHVRLKADASTIVDDKGIVYSPVLWAPVVPPFDAN